jgi:hypothetical protein
MVELSYIQIDEAKLSLFESQRIVESLKSTNLQ